MPDINEWEIFKNDIDRDREVTRARLNEGLREPTRQPLAESYIPEMGSFSNGEYKTNAPKSQSLDDLAGVAIRKFNPQDVQDMYDPYAVIDKDFNATFDNYTEKKYIKGDLGYDVTKSLEENEQRYFDQWDKQNWFVKGAKTIGTFATNVVAKAGLKFAEGIGFIGSAVNPMNYGDDYMLKVADNSFSKFFEQMEEGLKDDSLTRTFKDSNYNDLGFFSKMGTSEFWGSEAADGVAFMLSAMIPIGGISSRIGKGLSLLAKGSQIAEEGTLAARLAEVGVNSRGGLQFAGRLGDFSSTVFGSKSLAAPVQWAYSVASEAFFEARGVVDILNERRKDPNDELYNMPQEEFELYKSEHAKNTFLANTALLSMTNLFQTRLLFKALGKGESAAVKAGFNGANKAILRESTNRVSKFFNTRLGASLSGLAKGTAIEGYIEENAQLAIERVNSSNNKEYLHYDPNSNLFSQYLQQYAGQTKQVSTLFGGEGDNELSTSIGLGGLLGGGMSIINTNLQRKKSENGQPINYSGKNFFSGIGYGEVRNKKDNEAMIMADLENRYTNWQDARVIGELKAKYTALQQKLSTATPEEKTKIQEDLNNISKDFLATSLATQSKAKGLSEQLIIAEELENSKPIESSLLRSKAFTDYFISANSAGLGESLLQSLRDTEDLDVEELRQFGLDPDSYNPKQQEQYIKIAETILNSKDDYNLEGFRTKSNLLTYEGLETLNTNRKNRALNHKVNALIYQTTIDEHQEAIRQNRYHSSDIPELNSLQEAYTEYLENIAAVAQGEQNLKSKTLSKEDRYQQSSRILRAQSAIDKLKSDTRYEAVDWSALEDSVTFDSAANLVINNVTSWMLADKVGNLYTNPELSEKEQETQRKEYQDRIEQQSKDFQDALLKQVVSIYALSSYKNAEDINTKAADRLAGMDADYFMEYLKEQQLLDKKDAEESTPLAKPVEATPTEDEPVLAEVPRQWFIEESNGTYKIKDQDGNYYKVNSKDAQKELNEKNENGFSILDTKRRAEETYQKNVKERDEAISKGIKDLEPYNRGVNMAAGNTNRADRKIEEINAKYGSEKVFETTDEDVANATIEDLNKPKSNEPESSQTTSVDKASTTDAKENLSTETNNTPKVEPNSEVEKELKRRPAKFIPIKRNTPTGSEVLTDENVEFAEQRIERLIQKGIEQNKTPEEIHVSVNNAYAFSFGAETLTLRSFIEDRIAGKTNQSFGDFRKDTHKEINDRYTVATSTVTQATQEVSTPQAGYADIAADYLINAGVNNITSTDYFLQALSGLFTKANVQLNDIRNRYTQELADKNLVQVKDLIGTPTYFKLVKDIRDSLNQAYNNNIEAQNILDELLKYPGGLPTKLGQEIGIRLDKLHGETIDTPVTEPVDTLQPSVEEAPVTIPVVQIGLNPTVRKRSEYLLDAEAILELKDKETQVRRAELFLTEVGIVSSMTNIPEDLKKFFNWQTFKDYITQLKDIVTKSPYKTGVPPVTTAPVIEEPTEEVSIPPIIVEPTAEIEEVPFEDQNPLAIYSSNKTVIRNTQKDETGKNKTATINGVEAQYLTENKHTLFTQDVLPQVFTEVSKADSPYELVVLKDKIGDKDIDPEWQDKTRYADEEIAKKNLGIVLAVVKKGSNTPLRLSKNEAGELRIKPYSEEGENGFLATYYIDKNAFSQDIQEKFSIIRRKLKDPSITDDFIRETYFKIDKDNKIIDRLIAESKLNSTDRIVVTPNAISQGVQSNKSTLISKIAPNADIDLIAKGARLVKDGQLSVRLGKGEETSIPVFPSTISKDQTNGNLQVFDALKSLINVKHSEDNLDVIVPLLAKLLYVNRVRGGKYTSDILAPKSEYSLIVSDGKVAVQDREGKFVPISSLRINPLLSYFKENKQIVIPRLVNNVLETIEVDPQEYFKNSSYTWYKPVTKDGKTFEADTIQQYITFDYQFVEDPSSIEESLQYFEDNKTDVQREQEDRDNEVYTDKKVREEADTNSTQSGINQEVSAPVVPDEVSERETIVEQVIEKKTSKKKKRINDLLDQTGTKAQIAPIRPNAESLVGNNSMAKEYFKGRFPQVPVEIVDGFIKIQKTNELALGLFSTKLVQLSSLADKETAYHEAFHVAFNLFLTKKQQEDILSEASTLYGIKRNSEQSTEKAFGEFQQGSAYYNQQTNDVQLEERLAFDFQKMKRGSQNLTLTERLSKWLNELLNKLRAFLTGKSNIQDLYNRIESGYFAKQSTLYEAGDVTRLSVYDQDGKQVMSLPKANYYSTMANGFLYDLFADPDLRNASSGQITINDLKNPTTARNMYNYIKGSFQDELEDSTDPRVQKELRIILDNWDSFLTYHKSTKTIDSNLDLDELDKNQDRETEEPESTTDTPEKDSDIDKLTEIFDTVGNDKSSFESMSFKLKSIFSILPKMEKNPDYTGKKSEDPDVNTLDLYVPSKDENGVNLPVDTQNLIDYVASKMAGEINDILFFEQLFGTFNNEGFVPSEMVQKVPDIYGLMKLLPQWDKESPSLDEALLVTEFFRIFSKGKVELYSIITETDSKGNVTTVARKATPNNEFKVQDKWISNWQTNKYGITKTSEIKVINGKNETVYHYFRDGIEIPEKNVPKNYKDLSEGVKYYEDDIDDKSLIFLRNIGIELSPDAQIDRIDKVIEAVTVLRKQFTTPKENPVELLKNNRDSEVRKMYYTLVDIESKYSTLSPSLGVANASGEMRYVISELNTLQNFIYHVNKSPNISELYKRMPQLGANQRFETSKTYKELFYPQDHPNKSLRGTKISGKSVYLWNYAEFGTKKGNQTFSQSTNELSAHDKLIMDMQALLGANIINTPQSESKQTFYSMGIQNEGKQTTTVNPHFATAASFMKDFSNPSLHNYIKGLYATIGNKNGSEMDFIRSEETIDQDINDFFENALSDLKDRISKEVGTMSEFQQAVGLHIFNKQGEGITNTNIDFRTEASLRAFIVNKFINDLEYMVLISGPLEYYGQYIKRTPAWTSTGTPVTNLSIVNNYLKKNSELRLNKNPIDRSDNTFRTNTVSNKVTGKNSKEHQDWVKTVTDEFTNPVERKNLTKLLTQDVDVADGQGYINLDYYKNFLLNAGRWNPEMEVAYRFEVLTYKTYKKTITDSEKKELEGLNRLVYGQGIHNFVLPVLKFQNAGFIVGTDRPTFHKFSLAPMLPSHLIGRSKELTQEMEAQIEKGFAYTTHKSGSKLEDSSVNPIGNLKINDKDLTHLYLEGLKEQLKTDNHQKKDVITGSQFRKLPVNGLFGADKTTPPEIIRLNQQFLDLTRELIKLSKDKLYNKLGIEFDNNQLVIKDFTKLSTILQEEATKKGINTNVKAALDVDKDGRLRNQFESTGMAVPVLDLLFGIIDKTIRVQKTNGNQMVQYSNAYHEALDFYKLNKDKSRIEKAGVRITLTAEFRKLLNGVHPDSDKIATLERLNGLLKDPTWTKANEDAITIVGYRIPTQSQNSMDFAIVEEFLPPTSGNIIQLYDQITLKSGADFDIDKLFVLFPSLTNEGSFIDDSRVPQLKQEAESIRRDIEDIFKTYQPQRLFDLQLYDNVDKLINDIFSSQTEFNQTIKEAQEQIQDKWNAIKEIEDADKKSIQNKLLRTYYEILSHPSQFKALVTPNNTEDLFSAVAKHNIESQLTDASAEDLNNIKANELTDAQKKIKLPVGSANLSYATSSFDMYKLLMGQKRLLGVAAKQNTLFSQLQQGEFNIYTQQVIKTKAGNVTRQRTYFPLRFQDNAKFIQDNPLSIPINKGTDPFGKSVNETNDQMVTGFVDSPSNAMLGASGLSFENINIFYYLRWTGHSIEQIIDFLNQPILKNFYLLKNKGYSNKGDVKNAYIELVSRYYKNTSDYETDMQQIERFIQEDIKKGIKLTEDDIEQIKDRYSGQDWNQKTTEAYLNEKLWNYKYYSPEEIKVQKVASKENQDADFMMQMLANFRHFQIITSELGGYTSDKNFDTSKVSSHLTAQQRINNTKKYKDNPFITPKSIEDFEKSLIYTFNNDEQIVNTVQKVLPIFGSKLMTDQLVKDMFGPEFRGLSKTLKETYPKVLMQEFMTAIVHNFGQFEGNNLQQVGDKYIFDRQESFYHDFRELINTYPELYKRLSKNNALLSNIFFESDGKFKVLIDRQNKEVATEIYITELQSLVNNDVGSGGQSPALKKELSKFKNNEEVTKYINDIFTKFSIAAFKLGGFSKGRYYITQMLPLDIMTPIFKGAVDRFEALPPERKEKFIKSFRSRFLFLNPKYNPEAESKKPIENKNYNLAVQGENILAKYKQPASPKVLQNRAFKKEEYHQLFIKQGLQAVIDLIQKNQKIEKDAAKQLSKEVDMLMEFEELNKKVNKTNSENDTLIELYSLLKGSKQLDFEYSLKELGLPNNYKDPTAIQPEVSQPTQVSEDLSLLDELNQGVTDVYEVPTTDTEGTTTEAPQGSQEIDNILNEPFQPEQTDNLDC